MTSDQNSSRWVRDRHGGGSGESGVRWVEERDRRGEKEKEKEKKKENEIRRCIYKENER